VNHGHLATVIPGAAAFLQSLTTNSAPWAIVTSSSSSLATGWLNTFDLPSPDSDRLITAESVKVGKPDPTCYFLGRKSLGSSGDDGESLLVIEDSPAGIRAGKDAGCKVLGLVTSHTYEQVKSAGPDWIVKDLKSVKILGKNGDRVMVEICNAI
jgi:glycerol-1-phosphatase